MFNLKVRAGQGIKNDVISETATIAEGIRQMDLEMDTNVTVTLNGRMILPTEMDKTFEDFDVKSGDSAVMNLVVKAQSAGM